MKKKYPELPYTIEELREWLRSLKGDSSAVGYSCMPRSCPAARWLGETLGADVRVEGETVRIDLVNYSAPEWLINFQEKVDKWPRGAEIGRRQALNLLTRAEKGH